MAIEPVVVRILGTNKSALEAIAVVKAGLLDLAKSTTTATISGDSKPFQATLGTVKGELLNAARQVTNLRLGGDAQLFYAKLAEVSATVKAMSPLDMNIDANIKLALAKIAEVVAAAKLAKADITIGTEGKTGAVADAAATGGLASILRGILGFGTGGIPGLGALAGFGTLGAMAGLGPEHAIGTAAGLAGFAGSALAGGGLLAAGTAGVGAVGMGTDLAGIGQAAGDIKNVTSALSALNQVGGRTAANQLALNQALSGFSPVARSAVLAASKTALGFKAMFDQLTGPAEKIGAQIIQQVMQVGEKFLPTIGAFATKNTALIKKDIQPLLTWLQSTGKQGGLGIFTNLEKIFSAQLPTMIHAGTQAMELFARTINVAAGYTGRFLPKLDAFLTRWNSLSNVKFQGKTEGFQVWTKDIGKLIGDFRTLEAFLKSVGRAFTGLLKPAQGTGSGIITTLTGMIDSFDKWERSAAGVSEITKLLQAHKAEIIQILKLLPGIVSAFGKIELTAGPALTNVVNLFLKFVNAVLRIPGVGKIAAYGVAFGVIASKMKLLGGIGAIFTGAGKNATAFEKIMGKLGQATGIQTLVTKIGGMASSWASSLGKMIAGAAKWVAQTVAKIAVVVATNVASAATSAAAWIAANALMTAGIAILVAAMVVAVVEIIKHWRGLVTGLKAIWSAIKTAAVAVWHFIESNWKTIVTVLVGVIMGPIGALVVWLATHWSTVKKDAVKVWNAIVTFFKGLAKDFLAIGGDIINGIVKGIKGAAGKAINGIKKVGSDILSGFKSILHIFSPSQDFVTAGQNIVAGITQGLTVDKSNPVSTLTTLSTSMLAVLKNAVPQFRSIGLQLMQGLAAGIQAGTAAAVAAAVSAANAITAATKAATKTSSPSQVYAQIGSDLMAGLAQGINNSARLPRSAMVSAVGALGGTASVGASGGRGGAGGGGVGSYSPTYNLHVQGDVSPQTLAKLKQMLQEHDNQLVQRIKSGTAFGG